MPEDIGETKAKESMFEKAGERRIADDAKTIDWQYLRYVLSTLETEWS